MRLNERFLIGDLGEARAHAAADSEEPTIAHKRAEEYREGPGKPSTRPSGVSPNSGSWSHDGLPPGRALYRVPPVRRVFLLLPVLVGLGILAGILFESQRAGRELPPFTPARPPEFRDLLAPSGSATLEGLLVAPGGDPVPDASVYVRSGGVPAWTYTDREGAFRLEGLQPETATAVVMAWGFPPTEFEVLPGGPSATLTLPPRSDQVPSLPDVARAELQGRVLHPLGLEGSYEVVLLPLEPPHLMQGPVAVRTRTDPGGRFRFEGLATGRYRALVLPEWAQGGSWPNLAARLDAPLEHVLDGEPLDLHLAAGALAGRLRDPADLPIEGGLVLLSRAQDPTRVWPPTLSGPTGRFRLGDLPPGDYLLEIRAGEGALSELPIRIKAGRLTELPLTTLRIREDRAVRADE